MQCVRFGWLGSRVFLEWQLAKESVGNRRGNDEGTQYRSRIYYHTDAQKGTGNWGYCRATIVPKLKKMGLLKPEENK
jgi:hypothetical protein